MNHRHSHWYKDAIIYEMHVKSFCDSNEDGIGDFKGITSKLDYVQDLGVTAIWILPFYPSPQKDDGYDIADYRTVHPNYGTLYDFKRFLKEAHKRGLKVITELVINHTSDQHPWFQRARKAPKGSKWRDFYMWSEKPDKYLDARIIFQDFEASNWTWDPVANSYYWHRFYYHQPDLNFDNPMVRQEIFKILSYWLKMGVDGLRLDAIPYLYAREGTNCENLPETHSFLKELRAFVDENFFDKMLLAEANQWPEDAAKYFGKSDECHMAFHFPIMPRLFMGIHLEDSLPIMEIAGQTPKIPEGCQWALFLRNHDELTLEMVTDEERDYMFRVYAHDPQARINLGIRRRLAPLLKNDRRKVELMNSLLFSLIGTPVLYYGDEIGMGDNIYLGDRDGVRTPMQWSNDRNAGFSRANPQALFLPPIIDPEYHYETVNVEAQTKNPYSLFWWTKQLISLRKRFRAFGHGATKFLHPENRKVLVFIRSYQHELIFIVSNLSRYAQYIELDLSQYEGYQLVELFSGERFPKIGALPYFLTLGPYGYYWFSMEKQSKEQIELAPGPVKGKKELFYTLNLRVTPQELFSTQMVSQLENLLSLYLIRSLWAAIGRAKIDKIKLKDHFSLGGKIEHLGFKILILNILYTNGLSEQMPLVVGLAQGKVASHWHKNAPEKVIAVLKVTQKKACHEWTFYDATEEPRMGALLKEIIDGKLRIKNTQGILKGMVLSKPREEHAFLMHGQEIHHPSREEKATIYPHEKGVMRLFTFLDESQPDIEMRRFLAKKTSFTGFLPLQGAIEYQGVGGEAFTLVEELAAYPEEFRSSHLAMQEAERFLLRLEPMSDEIKEEELIPKLTWMELSQATLPKTMHDLLEAYLEVARSLGEQTGAFHLAVVKDPSEKPFTPMSFTPFYQRSLYQTMRRKAFDAFNALKRVAPLLTADDKQVIKDLLAREEGIVKHFYPLPHLKLSGQRIRIHGNYILENLYFTGREFLISEFQEKNPPTFHKRILKQSPLVDIAYMLYSFMHIAMEAVERHRERGQLDEISLETLEKRAIGWSIWIGSSFLRSYFRTVKTASFLPDKSKETDFLLSLYLTEHILEHLSELSKAKSDQLLIPAKMLIHWDPIYSSIRKRVMPQLKNGGLS